MPTGGAKQQVFSSDRKRFIVLQVKTISSDLKHSARISYCG
jgi:hypothetical protein